MPGWALFVLGLVVAAVLFTLALATGNVTVK
jgi:hypothetical protein